MQLLLDQLSQSRVIDLAQPWFVGMPHWPTHPPFAMALTKAHGEFTFAGGASSSAELIALGTHVGTHIDGLGHFSCNGMFYQERTPAETGIDRVPPIVRRGVLFDIPCDAEDTGITAEDLRTAQRAPLHAGDVVLIRTGWGRRWQDARAFVNEQRQPGLTLQAAEWLSSQGVFAIGSDNVALERIPSPSMEVHVHLLVERGIHIIECLNLEQLAAEGLHEFAFVAAPLKITGATGSPLRPFALVKQ